ncbi:hypothetical protein [Roseovarius rhodophyticola]|uniref:Uncharacterized protein n=1 Tax=Roseovarius rhodophyticola TaxID=3080827 RepID=A0ABZ2TB86_9RHOB|nr:hypothetical protein [Roseovarius sp. W115]MDV2930654.1 hypothetical protein [Roseovarius sp. W115]
MGNITNLETVELAFRYLGLGSLLGKAWGLFRIFLQFVIDFMIMTFLSDTEEDGDGGEGADEPEFWVSTTRPSYERDEAPQSNIYNCNDYAMG